MGSSRWRAGVAAFLALASASACGGSTSNKSGSDRTCAAGARRCDGSNVKVCNEDGTAERIQATCSPSQSCSDGACRQSACVENTRFCRDGSVWSCDRSGGSSLAQPCGDNSFCREADGEASCTGQACSAGEPLCNGSVATICQEDGAGPLPGGTDCESTGRVCSRGECQPVSCTPGMKLCRQEDVYLCAPDGTEASLLVDCGEGEVCDGAVGECRAKRCDPGRSSCEGSLVTTCNEYGSAWLTPSTDCADSSSSCVDGSCKKQLCVPNERICSDGAVYECNASGLARSLVEECQGPTTCLSTPLGVACLSRPCTAGSTACIDNKIGTCAADGLSLAMVSADCTASASICGADLECAKTTVDTIGAAHSAVGFNANQFIGNVVDVRSPRQLTELGLNVVLKSSRQLRWVVYEQTGNLYTSRFDKVVFYMTSVGFVSSGALTYPLEAGKRYLLGAAITGGDGLSHQQRAPFEASTSFGAVVGHFESGYETTLQAGIHSSQAVYHLKVTTEAR